MSRKWWILTLVAPLGLALDQITKTMVRAWIPEGHEYQVIPDFFRLIHVENPGAAWGFLGGYEHRLWIFIGVSLLAFLVIALYFRGLAPGERWQPVALSLLLAGAGGNFVDRVRFREVTDFVDLYIGWDGALREWLLVRSATSHYPTFNVADVCIVAGVVMFLLHVLILEPRALKREKVEPSAPTAPSAPTVPAAPTEPVEQDTPAP